MYHKRPDEACRQPSRNTLPRSRALIAAGIAFCLLAGFSEGQAADADDAERGVQSLREPGPHADERAIIKRRHPELFDEAKKEDEVDPPGSHYGLVLRETELLSKEMYERHADELR
jgi:hypothetical protein